MYCKKAALPIVVETMPAERKLSFYLDMCSFAFDPDPLLQHPDSSPPVAFQPGTPPAIDEKRCVCVCVCERERERERAPLAAFHFRCERAAQQPIVIQKYSSLTAMALECNF